MLVYIVSFACGGSNHIVGAYSTREKALEARKVYNAHCSEGDYTFINEIVMDTAKEYI